MSAKITSNEDNVKALGYLDAAAKVLLKNCEGLPYGYEFLRELKPDLCLEIAKQRLMYSLNKSPMADEVSIFLKKTRSNRSKFANKRRYVIVVFVKTILNSIRKN